MSIIRCSLPSQTYPQLLLSAQMPPCCLVIFGCDLVVKVGIDVLPGGIAFSALLQASLLCQFFREYRFCKWTEGKQSGDNQQIHKGDKRNA